MKRLDRIIIAVALTLGAIPLLIMNHKGETPATNVTIEISVNGITVESMPFATDSSIEQWIEGAYGRLLLQVDADGIFVAYADCPSQDCVHRGKITAPGQMIICLPNRILIRLTGDTDGDGREMEIDAFVR